MSVESAIDKISSDLHRTGLSPLKQPAEIKDKKTKDAVADSWEDDASDSDNETKSPTSDYSSLEAPGPTHLKSPTSRAVDAEKELEAEIHGLPQVPPPTPISPSSTAIRPDWSPVRNLASEPSLLSSLSSNGSTPRYISTPMLSSNPTPRHGAPESPRPTGRDTDRRRPEKTTATANRLIAGALGIKAPPKTEEQRKYERAVKEQEMRRRNKEKEDRKKEAEEDEKLKTAIWDS